MESNLAMIVQNTGSEREQKALQPRTQERIPVPSREQSSVLTVLITQSSRRLTAGEESHDDAITHWPI